MRLENTFRNGVVEVKRMRRVNQELSLKECRGQESTVRSRVVISVLNLPKRWQVNILWRCLYTTHKS